MTETTLNTLKVQIADEFAKLKAAYRTTLVHARQIGEYLSEVKQGLSGRWIKWVTKNCEFSYQTARKYVLVAEHWAEFDLDELAALTIEDMAEACSTRRPRKATVAPSQSPPANTAPADRKSDTVVAAAAAQSGPTQEVVVAAEAPATILPLPTPEKGVPLAQVEALSRKYHLTGDVVGFLAELGVAVQGRAVA